jgi:hypothetical protein
MSRFLHDPDICLHSNFNQATFLPPPQAPTLPASNLNEDKYLDHAKSDSTYF